MKKLRNIAIAVLALVVLGLGNARAASTTDYTDQWWIPAESGWGVSVYQQWDTLFFLFFVYGTDNKPTWFVAVATPQAGSPAGHTVFTGDVYATTGPYFGGPFESFPVVERLAGTISFDADSATTATLTYTIDGTTVEKNVTRQAFSRIDLTGRYYGGNVGEQTVCGEDTGHYEQAVEIEIIHAADDSFTMKWIDDRERVESYTGTYVQSGRFGQVVVTGYLGHEPGITATGTLFEIERTFAGVTGRGHLEGKSGGAVVCVWEGRFGGVRR